MEKLIDIWNSISLNVKTALIAAFVSLAIFLFGTILKPSSGRYLMINQDGLKYDIFDSATGKVYYWGGTNGLRAIDDPVHNKMINVIKRECKILEK